MTSKSNFCLTSGLNGFQGFKSIALTESESPLLSSRSGTPSSGASTPTTPGLEHKKTQGQARTHLQQRPVSAPTLPKKGTNNVQQLHRNSTPTSIGKIAKAQAVQIPVKPKNSQQIDNALNATAKDLANNDWQAWVEFCEGEFSQFSSQNALKALEVVADHLPQEKQDAFCQGGVGNLVPSLCELIQKDASRLTPQQLSKTSSVLARLRFNDIPTLIVVGNEMIKKIDKSTSTDFAMVLRGYAKLGFVHAPLFAALKIKYPKNLPYWPTKDLCQILWAAAVCLNCQELARQTPVVEDDLLVFQNFFEEIEKRCANGTSLGHVELSELLAAFNYVELFHDNYFDAELYPFLSEALKQFTEEQTAQSQKSSKTHMHVQKMLEKMVGRKLQKEQFINGYYADIVLTNTNSDRHLVEIQGPTHYLQSGSDTGDHFLRKRILNALGYRVTDLRVVEWGACIVHNKGKFNHRATVQKQRAFLKKKLAESIQRVPLLQQKEEGKAVKKEEGKATVSNANGSTVQGHTTPLLQPK